MSVVIVTPFHQAADPDRRDIMSRVFHHLALIPDAVVLGIGSEREVSQDLWSEYHSLAGYREYEQTWTSIGPSGNEGLRDKFNAGIRSARDYDPDFVFICGSDDLVPEGFFVPSDADLVGPAQGAAGGMYLWEYGKPEAFWWPGFPNLQLIGGAQGFSTKLLDALDWSPYQFAGDEIGLERYVTAKASSYKIEPRTGVASWAPKCDAVLNSFELCQRAHDLKRVDDATFATFKSYWDSL